MQSEKADAEALTDEGLSIAGASRDQEVRQKCSRIPVSNQSLDQLSRAPGLPARLVSLTECSGADGKS